MEFLHPPHWMRPSGYSNGVAAEGRQIFVAGQIAWDAERQIVSDDFVAQVEQALRNVVHVLAEASARPEDLVRLTWYVLDKQEYMASLKEVGTAYRALMGRHFPTMAVVQVGGLIEPEARLEIEATAVIPEAT